MVLEIKAQVIQIKELMDFPLKKGDTWFLIDYSWFRKWKTFVGLEGGGINVSFNPGIIDNSKLFSGSSNILRQDLCNLIDYYLVCEEIWNKLVSWYGLKENQFPIARKVVDKGMFFEKLQVEIYPLSLRVKKFDQKNYHNMTFSAESNLSDVKDVIAIELGLQRQIRLWREHEQKMDLLANMCLRIYDSGLYINQLIIVEMINSDGTWPLSLDNNYNILNNFHVNNVNDDFDKIENTNPPICSPKRITLLENLMTHNSHSNDVDMTNSNDFNENHNETILNECSGYLPFSKLDGLLIKDNLDKINGTNPEDIINLNNEIIEGKLKDISTDEYNSTTRTRGKHFVEGVCGLGNLGNTCFMNSAIQCLSQVEGLTKYMLSGKWREEINKENLSGANGEIVISYAELIQNMWSGQQSYTDPSVLKNKIGKFKPAFSGFQQEDSQELMSILLEGLHEDLKRIIEKPSLSQNKDVKKLEKDSAWCNYKKLNDSIIIDNFHGLLKTTIVCQKCNKVSVKFDPFSHLSLPLPIKELRQIEINLVRLNSKIDISQFKVTTVKHGTIEDLTQAFSAHVTIPANKMFVVKVFQHEICKFYSPTHMLSDIIDSENIYIYEMEITIDEQKDYYIIPVNLREEKIYKIYGNSNSTTSFFGDPVLIVLPRRKLFFETIYNAILGRMTRCIKNSKSLIKKWQIVSIKNYRFQEISNSAGTSPNISDDDMNGENNNNTEKGCLDQYDISEDDEENNVDNNMSDNSDISTNGVDDATDYNAEKIESGYDMLSKKKKKKVKRFFKLIKYNFKTHLEIGDLRDDEMPLVLDDHIYIVAHWIKLAKELFYDEKNSNIIVMDSSMNNTLEETTTVQLDDCFNLYTNPEELSDNNLWYCTNCKKDQKALKKDELWQLPDTLIIQLKRFYISRLNSSKIDHFIDYPIRNLNLNKWIINTNHLCALYNLIAVSNHYGAISNGHYTTYGKNFLNEKWYEFDDKNGREIDEHTVKTQSGYVLVYQIQKKSAKSTGLNSIKKKKKS